VIMGCVYKVHMNIQHGNIQHGYLLIIFTQIESNLNLIILPIWLMMLLIKVVK